MKCYVGRSFTVASRWRTYLKLEFPVAEEGGLAEYFEALVIIFDACLFIVCIQIRVGLDESG